MDYNVKFLVGTKIAKQLVVNYERLRMICSKMVCVDSYSFVKLKIQLE